MTNSPPTTTSWVDQIRILPLSNSSASQSKASDTDDNNSSEFNIASFNVLAESYLSPRSHPGLPPSHAAVAFDAEKRRRLLIDTLRRFCGPSSGSDTRDTKWDIMALQELDLLDEEEGILPALSSWGYEVICTPTDQRRDCCAVAFDRAKFRLVESQVVKFDDLACLRASEAKVNSGKGDGEGATKQYAYATIKKSDATFNTIRPNSKSSATELTGMVRSFLRRNCAIIAHLEATHGSNGGIRTDGQSFLVASAHLYWHPGYEYVKLCQAKYLLDRAYAMATESNTNQTTCAKRIPTIICGDMNSKPGSIVHQFFVTPEVDARTVAPWHHFWDQQNEVIYAEEEEGAGCTDDRIDGQDPVLTTDGNLNHTEEPVESNGVDTTIDNGVGLESQFCSFIIDEPNNNNFDPDNSTPSPSESPESIGANYNTLQATLAARRNAHKSPQDYQHATPAPAVKYVCDYTLNRFTRWLRILGIDATLETEEEEKERTKGNRIALFEHCKKEGRTLLTTSYKLLLRKDSPPGAYLLDPKSTTQLVELALPRLLRTHGVELSPCVFLTRCVVCNGKIHRVFNDDEKRDVFLEHGAPDLVNSVDNMEVFRCDGCRQGYWWDDKPTSSASRVFAQATKLFRSCIRGGVRIKNTNLQNGDDLKEVMGAFAFVDVEKERECWNSEVGKQVADLAVIEWLREDKLANPFQLRSAYYIHDNNGKSPSKCPGETLPFSNVTLDFVGLLDYVFFDQDGFEQVGRLHVPTSFRDMNASLVSRGHLLPSAIWPSDHLAVGARLRLINVTKSATDPTNMVSSPKTTPISHAPRCACGCVPNILSLFEMAELRKKAREAAKAQTETT